MKADALKLLMQAGNPIISIETPDELRAARAVRKAAADLGLAFYQWSVTEGLSQAESMAPIVLWIDEIEKAFASASSESADGGLSQRMFGTLLAWMQDHRHPIFLIATANNLAQLPPELMRKGRFDEVFFVDLPGREDRSTIFAIHFGKRRRDAASFDLVRLVEATEGFSGAEIEQAVISGMYAAFGEGQECGTEHILAAIESTQPLSVIMRERVDCLRAWAKGRCVPAD